MVAPRPSPKQVFMDAIELSIRERAAYVVKVCGDDEALRRRVEALLEAHGEASAVLGEPTPAGVPARAPEDFLELQPGDVVRDYRLEQRIGVGGFGEVWMAEQERPLRRMVALKVLKIGMDSKEVVARFEAERQALAMMDHPGIAKIHDAGTTARGRPFFVMELVDGESITTFCEARELGTRARVRLVRDVCAAIRHAHRRGVIHRDIKPNNVLVTEQDGRLQPKVIDFGIAKAVGGRLGQATIHTRGDQIVGTPGYMSPEQVDESLDVDTRTDVYSTGALLYELLAGRPPIDVKSSNLVQIQHKIATEEPKRPSTWLGSAREAEAGRAVAALRRRDVEGDLDWIVMRCLEKDRERRYDSMGELAADLDRYLDGEVVLAGPPTLRYRLSKFGRRHWRGLLVASVIVGLLLGGILVSTSQAHKALMAEREAREELVRATAVARFLEDLLMTIDPASAGERDTELLEEILEGAIARVEAESQGLPRVEAQLRHIIGGAQFALGNLSAAEEQFGLAVRLREAEFGFEHPATLNSAAQYAPILAESGEYYEGIRWLERTLEGQREVLGPEHPDTITTLSNLGATLQHHGARAQAEPVLREVEALQVKRHGPENEDALLATNNLAILLLDLGQVDAALERLEFVVEQQTALHTLTHPRTLASMSNLAACYDEFGQSERAEALYREVLAQKHKILPAGHSSLLIGQNNLARLLSESGKHEEAAALRATALEASLEHHGLRSRFTLTLLLNEGKARAKTGEWTLAEEPLRQVVAEAPGVFPSPSQLEVVAVHELGKVLVALERFEEAEAVVRPYLATVDEVVDPASNASEVAHARYGVILHELGRDEEALPLLEEAVRALDPRGPAAELRERVAASLETIRGR